MIYIYIYIYIIVLTRARGAALFHGPSFTSIISISRRLGGNRFTWIRTAHVKTQHDATHKTRGKHFYTINCDLLFIAGYICPWYWAHLLCLACIYTVIYSLYCISKLCSDVLIVFRKTIMGVNLISPRIVNLVYCLLFITLRATNLVRYTFYFHQIEHKLSLDRTQSEFR
jgi:hypothetical protein